MIGVISNRPAITSILKVLSTQSQRFAPSALSKTGAILPIHPSLSLISSIRKHVEGCIHDLKMTLEGVRRGFHGVFLIAIMWFGMQGKGYGLVTDSQNVDGINNKTSTSVTQRPKELATTPSMAPAFNDTLGTKLYCIAVCCILICSPF